MNRYSSNELIIGIRKRDNAVLGYIYQKYYNSIQHFVINNSGTTDDARDTFQEAMIVVFENITKDKDFKMVCQMQTYIYSIARILWIKQLNKSILNRTKLNENHEFIEFEEPQPFKEHDFKFALYQRAFLELPKDCQNILNLANNGKNNAEIAAIMKLSESYVAKRKHFCKDYLIKLVRGNPDFYSDKL